MKTKLLIQKIHDENMTYLKERLASNSKLTDPQKQEMISFFETQFQENVSFKGAKQQAHVAEFEKIMSDESLTPEQKKAAMKTYMDQQKASSKEHHEKQKGERKAKMQEMKPASGTVATPIDPAAPSEP